MYQIIIKPLLDIIISFVILLITSPLIIFIWILLKISYPNFQPFYFQFRPGKKGKLFKVIKFKTMTDKKDNNGNLLPDNERLTKIGKIIRSMSIDELPQLINVLKGDMSIVGPRPLLEQYLSLYSKKHSRRHQVKPGITGWAQVNGRNAISWEQKFEYDVWYVDNISLWLDIKILFITIKRVILRDGINSANNITMEPFKGSN